MAEYQKSEKIARHDRNTAIGNVGLVCLGLGLTVMWGFCPPTLIATVVALMVYTVVGVAYKYHRRNQRRQLEDDTNTKQERGHERWTDFNVDPDAASKLEEEMKLHF